MKLSGILLIALSLAAVGTAHADLVVIAAADSSIERLDADTTRELFLGKRRRLPNGDTPHLVIHTDAQAAFCNSVLGKRESQVKAAWSRLVFSGRARPPTEHDSAGDVIRAVAARDDALGYIRADALGPGVKVVFEVPPR